MNARDYRALAAVALVVAFCGLALARQDRAQEVLARAREAIGGQGRLAAVTSLSVKASSVMTVPVIINGRPTTQRTKADLEIQILLPDKFLITRHGSLVNQVGGVNGTRLILERRPGVQMVFGGGDAIARMTAARQRELLRYLVGWLLLAPERSGVQFSDGGVARPEGEELNIVEAKGANDFAARLFFDAQSHLVMMTYQTSPASAPPTPIPEAKSADAEQPVFKSLEGPAPPRTTPPRETRLRLADYHADDGILFPHRMTFETGEQVMEWEIKQFKVNPPLDPKRFEPR